MGENIRDKNMKLFWYFFGAAFAANEELSAQEQKIRHLKKVTDGFVDWYLNDTIHQEDEALVPYEKRENILRRFKIRLDKLTNIAEKANENDCYSDDFSRSSDQIGRFAQNTFRKARIQIVRSFVKLGKQIPEENSSNKCLKKRENLLKKVEKLDEQLYDFYCQKIFVEEECTKEYNNDFISKVQV